MPEATATAPTTRSTKADPSHVWYLCTFPESSMDNYQTSVRRFYDNSGANPRLGVIYRQLTKMPFSEWKEALKDLVIQGYLERGYIKIVAHGERFIEGALEVGRSTVAETRRYLVSQCCREEDLQNELVWLNDQELSKDGELASLRKDAEARLEALKKGEVKLPSYGLTFPGDQTAGTIASPF